MTASHLPPGAALPPVPRGVVPLGVDLGAVAGHRVVLLSLEVWDGWADLRFARIDVGATSRLARRVPPAEAWSVAADARSLAVVDAVGRGDRTFSNGEVRVVPPPPPGASLEVTVQVAPGSAPLRGTVALPAG
jgi:hypothetical protein